MIPDVNRSRPSRSVVHLDSPTTFQGEGASAAAYPRDALFPALPLVSCFAYSPNGSGQLCNEGRSICARLKAADSGWLPRLVAAVWVQAAGHGRFAMALGDHVVLVPVPGSDPVRRAHWVGERLAWCLREIGLAAAVWPVLQRRYAVRKSAFAPASERPSLFEQYTSFAIERGGWSPVSTRLAGELRSNRPRLTLVDDVVTRGRTLLAAAARLREAFPAAEIRAFALLRTLARDEKLERLLDPYEGEVRWISGDARRNP